MDKKANAGRMLKKRFHVFFERNHLLMLKRHKLISWILILAAGLFMAGCAMGPDPLFMKYDEDANPVMTKRLRNHVTRDYLVHPFRKAYKENHGTGPHFLLSPDETRVKEEYGPPDYLSPAYLSRKGDWVKEWLYWKEGIMFQFVRGHLVFEGPLSDKERVLVQYGYPDDTKIYELGEGMERQNFYYHSFLGKTRMTFLFKNGTIIDSSYTR